MSLEDLGYQILEKVYESVETSVYKAINMATNIPVILKVSHRSGSKEGSEFKQRAVLEHENELLNILQSDKKNFDDGFTKTFGIEEFEGQTVLIMQDGGRSLSDFLKEKGVFSLEDFFTMAIHVTEILGQIHTHNIIHKDIKPANILLDQKDNKFYVIDFNISTILSKEKEGLTNTKVFEGSLPYMSPEQTGRMNRNIDYRSDFYSLGMTFYQLLTGELPYLSENPLDVIHFHITKPLPNLKEKRKDVPDALIKIIGKLVAKNAEDRYQTAYGIVQDLKKCYDLWKTNKSANIEFEIGKNDISGRFEIPQKLYGRELDVETLMSAFDEVCKGAISLLRIAGPSGIGKTSLVHEVHRPIVGKYGLFMSGKFEQFKRDIPYSALQHAFSELAKQLIVMGEEKFQKLKANLCNELQGYGRLITDFSDEMEIIFGKLPKVSDIAPTEAINRFNLNVLKFFKVLAREDHPVVIFIDDLQWADSASLELFKALLLSDEIKYLLFIGAYRDNEITKSHMFVKLEESFQEKSGSRNQIYEVINVGPLQEKYVGELINDMIGNQEDLTKIVFSKTKGNPFFVGEFLKTLNFEKLITFDNDQGKWDIDLKSITNLSVSENVVELMIKKIKKFPLKTQEVLGFASCLGSEFTLKNLSIVTESSIRDIASLLWPALDEGMLVPTKGDFHLVQGALGQEFFKKVSDREFEKLNISYRFAHDRIQQASNELSNKSDLAKINLKIGRLLLKVLSKDEINDKYFDIVNHFNSALKIIDNDEFQKVSKMNFEAAKKAISSMAFGPALNYIIVAQELLKSDFAKIDVETTFNYQCIRIESEYLNQHFEVAKEISLKTLSEFKDKDKQVEIYGHLITMHGVQSLNEETTYYMSVALKLLGINERYKLGRVRFVLVLIWFLFKTRKFDPEKYAELPLITDQKANKITEIISLGAPSAYLFNLEYLMVAIIRGFYFSHRYGVNSNITYLLAAIGAVENFFVFRFNFCQKAFKASEKILNRFPDDKSWSRHYLTIQYVSNRNFLPPEEAIEIGYKGLISGQNGGENTYAATSIASTAYTYTMFGISYKKNKKIAEEALQFSEKVKVHDMIWASKVAFHLSNTLQGETETFESLDDPKHDFVEERDIEFNLDEKHRGMRIICYTMQSVRQILNGEYQKVLDACFRFWDWSLYLVGSFGNPYLLMALSLSMGKMAHKKSVIRRLFWKLTVKIGLLVYGPHARLNKDNHGPYYNMIEASYELLKVSDKGKKRAVKYFQEAIENAKPNNYHLVEGIAAESIAEIYLGFSDFEKAHQYLVNAVNSYRKMDGLGKVKQLFKKYGGLAISKDAIEEEKKRENLIKSKQNNEDLETKMSRTTTSFATTTGTGSYMQVDMATLLQSAQVISREIKLEGLLQKMMEILLKNAGANRILFLTNTSEKDTTLVIRGMMDEGHFDFFEMGSSLDKNILAIPIVQYVKETGKTIIENNVLTEGAFSNDPYITSHSVKSILSMPIVNQGKLSGILYLENSALTDAFTSDRIELLNMLSSQMAVSVDNSLLYANLEEKVRERTEELKEAQKKMLEMAHMSGMADIASGVMHNIGNVLPSVNFQIESLSSKKSEKFISGFNNLNKMLKEKIELKDVSLLGDFLINDNKGKRVIDLYFEIEKNLHKEKEEILKIKENLERDFNKIKEIVGKHKEFTHKGDIEIEFNHESVIESIFETFPELKDGEGNTIKFQHETVEDHIIKTNKHKYMFAVHAIIKNAIEEIKGLSELKEKKIFFKMLLNPENDKELITKIYDNGRGVGEDIIGQIFNSGFTTKKGGGGAGLHDAYNFIYSMGGKITYERPNKEGSEFSSCFNIVIKTA